MARTITKKPARKSKPSGASAKAASGSIPHIVPKKGHVLILRTCAADMTSHGGFEWPAKGPVSAPDWDPAAVCGQGLHGFLRGEGEGELASWESAAKWLVVEAKESDVVDLDGDKVKFPRGVVRYAGTREVATAVVKAAYPGAAVIGAAAQSGNYGTSTSGNYGTSTSGYGGTSTSGNYGTSTSGNYGTSTSGYGGTSTSGNYGTSTSGNYGTSTSGIRGTSTSGYGGTSTSGNYGTSTSGNYGTSTSGYGGILVLRWYDNKADRYRLTVAYVGEGGIKAGVKYTADDQGRVVEADGQDA